MDLRKLKKLIELVQESGIAELEITEGEEKVKIVLGGHPSREFSHALPPAAPITSMLDAPLMPSSSDRI